VLLDRGWQKKTFGICFVGRIVTAD